MTNRLRFLTILSLLSILTFFASWATLQPLHKSPPFSHTSLLNLAAIDPSSAALHNATASLLAATLTNHSSLHPQLPTLLLLLNRLLRAWLRLRHRHTAIVPDLLRHVKRPIDLHYGYPDTARPYATCAVVGNSGLLLRSHLADLIDAHDIVIRLNYARVSGYEAHVGFKTSVSFINTNVLHLCARRKGCPCRPYGDFVPVVMYVCQAAHFVDYVVCNSTSSAPMIVTDPRLDLLCGRIVKYYSMRRFVERTGRRPEEWGEVRDEKAFHYSSGMQAVVLALGICDQVSLFGFGKPEGVKHHYHTNQKAELDLHDYEAEYDFYGDLVHRPQVIPFLKEAGFDATQVVIYQQAL